MEIKGSIIERNGVSAMQKLPNEQNFRKWLDERGVQDRWIDRLESSQGMLLRFNVRENYAFHIIQAYLILINVTVVH
jgi:hypothetical protein